MKGLEGIRTKRRAFSLVEIMAATMLLVIGFLGIFATFHSSAKLREAAEETNMAMFELKSVVEYIFGRPFDHVTTLLPDGAVAEIPGVTDRGPHAGLDLADKELVVTYDDPSADPLHFTVTITWMSRLGTQRTESISTARAR